MRERPLRLFPLASAQYLFLFLWIVGVLASTCRASIDPKWLESGKKATAYVLVGGKTTGTAFCVDPAGVFVTDKSLTNAAAMSLVVHPGMADERILSARVLRSDDTTRLALLQANGTGPFDAVALSNMDGTTGRADAAVLCYPAGQPVAPGAPKYPLVGASLLTTQAVRNNHETDQYLFDAPLPSASIGAPVCDEMGTVEGVVRALPDGTGGGDAISFRHLFAFLLQPKVSFDPSPIIFGNSRGRGGFGNFGIQDFDFGDLHVGLSYATDVNVDKRHLGVSLTVSQDDRSEEQVIPRKEGNNVFGFNAPGIGNAIRWDETSPPHPVSYTIYLRNNYSVAHALIFQQKGTFPLQFDPQKIPQVTAPAMPTTDDKTIVPLPASFDNLVVGGGGRYLVMSLKSLRKFAVFDTTTSQLRYLSVDADNLFFAASDRKLVVVSPDQKTITRYDLATLAKEITVALPDQVTAGLPLAMAMGTSSNGPFLLVARRERKRVLQFFDLESLQQLDVQFNTQGIGAFSDRVGISDNQRFHLRASGDGTTFVGWGGSGNLLGSGVVLWRLHGQSVEQENTTAPINYGFLSRDGNRVYTDKGVFAADLQPLDNSNFTPPVSAPTYSDAYFLGLDAGGMPLFPRFNQLETPYKVKVSVYSEANRRLLLTLPPLEELTVTASPSPIVPWNDKDVTVQERIHFYPGSNLLITIPATKDSLIVRHFNLLDALGKAGIDYLFVNSAPPPSVRKGATYTYQLDVKSLRGGVTYSLDSAPPTAHLSPQGLFTWTVPADHTNTEENIILSVHDASGQQILYPFKIRVLP